jgi:hypothetical protein
MNILPPKFRAHEMDSKTQNCNLRERETRVLNGFDSVSVIYVDLPE